jgi:hypothetical protein
MSNAIIVAKSENIRIIALKGEDIGLFTPVVIHNLINNTWSPPQYSGSVIKFMPYLIKVDSEEIDIPTDKVDELNKFSTGER